MQFEMKRVMCAVDGQTPLDAVVIFRGDLLLCVPSSSGRVTSAAASQPWPQLLNQLKTSQRTPKDRLNAEVGRR